MYYYFQIEIVKVELILLLLNLFLLKELFGHFLDFRFNGGGDEKPLTGRRALGLILLGLADSSGGKQENQGEINRFFHFSA